MSNAGRSDLYWAVVEHVRGWLGEDGALRHTVVEKGKLDGATLRRIAIVYNVNRGIVAKGADGDTHAQAVADLVNDARWPDDLIKRAEKCRDVAIAAAKNGHTHKVQASAVTKFSWFAQPDRWTVYDRFVARSMGVNNPKVIDRMVAFYKELDKRSFLSLADKIQQVLDGSGIMNLQGTRVLDKLMMLRGAESDEENRQWAEDFGLLCRGFLYSLPKDWRQEVDDLAKRVESRININQFLGG